MKKSTFFRSRTLPDRSDKSDWTNPVGLRISSKNSVFSFIALDFLSFSSYITMIPVIELELPVSWISFSELVFLQ